ncbi:MAG: Gfo/Idh/MocA family oxidoreductase [Candidatus Hydrogenedentes bacterium]|nr:Gfo/Idh/MocA family oxidoreductase [Candidatus Hydrogenedentota bacterium]
MNRRTFLATAAAAGTGMAVARTALGQSGPTSSTDDINVAIIGVGAEGRVLMNAMLNIKGVRFKAICDIWSYSQRYGQRYLKKYGHDVNVYEDYREMLDKEKDLDAVVVATPDWMNAEHAIACMEAGHHVYCEKEMSNSLEKARQMVLAARRTGKLLQIGHQRRSNPRYLYAINSLVHDHQLLGRVMQANAQWNRGVSSDLGWPKSYTMDPAKLAKYGYDSMSQFRNWRWYRKYGGGPIVDLGSHQIDIFSWVFQSQPKAVTATGGIDYYTHHEWYDTVMALYDFDTPEGNARAFYQVLTTTSNGGYYETFMGTDGTLVISENPNKTKVLRETYAPDWQKWVNSGVLAREVAPVQPLPEKEEAVLDVRESAELESWALPVHLTKPYHQPHLENFFDAIRIGKPLNCPAQIGYETAVAVLTVNDAVETGKKIEFKKEDFEVA